MEQCTTGSVSVVHR